jgi:hypothetical protein
MNEKISKHLFPVVILILFCVGIYFAFGSGPISDNAYGELLTYSVKFDISMVRFAVLFFTAVSSILIYFSFRENPKVGLLAAVLFMSANIPNMIFINSMMQSFIML